MSGTVPALALIGPVIGMLAMGFSGMRLLKRHGDLIQRHGALEREVTRLRGNAMAGYDWQEMMPFACDDAKMIGVFSDRTPTDQDRISAGCQVVWIKLPTSQVWKSTEPGVWVDAGTGRHYDRENDCFVAITPDDDFLFMHGGHYPGFRELIEYITSGSPDGLRQNDERARGINPMPFILMDAGAVEGENQVWQTLRGLRTTNADASQPAQRVAPLDTSRFHTSPFGEDRPRPIVLDDHEETS